MKQSVIIAFLGKTQDRFCEYNSPKTTYEKLQMVQQIKGFDGVEMVYPSETSTPGEISAMMKELGLHWAAINVKREPQFVPGSLSRPIKDVRANAVAMIKRAKDFAKAVGAPLVTCCPLSDGYDMLFQIDYQTAWKYMIETVGEAADYLPEIPLYLVGNAILAGDYDRRILCCGTGIGMAISANKIPGIRAAQTHDTFSAARAAKSNNAHIITLGARVVGSELAKTIVDAWLAAEFDPQGPSASNVAAIGKLDEKYKKSEPEQPIVRSLYPPSP